MPDPSAMTSSELARSLQERAARALPAEKVEHLDGWWLRHAPGCSWWVSTVLPHGATEAGDLADKITQAERFYARRCAATCFQVTPEACPEALDTLLAERGYDRESPVSLEVVPTARVVDRAPAGSPLVRLDDRLTSNWFEAWSALRGHCGDTRAEWEMLARIDSPSAYASVVIGSEVAGVGRSVADGAWAGVFAMATAPDARRQGVARAVLVALANWAGAQRADHLYLQVERANLSARRLYEQMGFGELCGFHYRRRAAT